MIQQFHFWVFTWRKQKHLRYVHPYVHCSIIFNSQDMEATEVPIVDEWIKKMWSINIYSGKLLSHNKEWNCAICNNMDGPRRYYAKWNKLEKDKYCMISLVCGILNEQTTKQKQSFRYGEQTGGCQRGRDWGGRKETGEGD